MTDRSTASTGDADCTDSADSADSATGRATGRTENAGFVRSPGAAASDTDETDVTGEDSSDTTLDSRDTKPELVIRRATAADRPAIIALCRASLGWKDGDPNEGFFEWKHDSNPFGVSPAWVAESPEGDLAGLRVFLRWEFQTPDRSRITAVRAVDTATHPAWQGKGIFTKLTLGAVEELKDDGLDVVFNTPNDQSRPGYLKMGWHVVGRVPVAIRVRSIVAATRLKGAKAAAEKWSAGATTGLDASQVLSASGDLQELLERLEKPAGIHTPLSVDYLQWRYDFAPLGYRALPIGDSLSDGLILFRVRHRGSATELTVCDVLAPTGAPVRRAIGYLLRTAGADYAIRAVNGTVDSGAIRAGFVPAPQLGPIMTWREVTRGGIPAMGDLSLTLGDIELF